MNFFKKVKYDPITGKMFYIKSGKEVKAISSSGHLNLSLGNKTYLLHRLAFFMMRGYWPRHIDHLDRDRLNNKWHNLRDVSPSENLKNMSIPSDNTSGVKGVSWNKHRKQWAAYINIDKKRKGLGWFLVYEHAVKARKKAEKEHGYL